MKKRVAIVLVIGTLLACSLAHAAEFRGKVTSNDGVTPVAGVAVYQVLSFEVLHDPGSFDEKGSRECDSACCAYGGNTCAGHLYAVGVQHRYPVGGCQRAGQQHLVTVLVPASARYDHLRC